MTDEVHAADDMLHEGSPVSLSSGAKRIGVSADRVEGVVLLLANWLETVIRNEPGDLSDRERETLMLKPITYKRVLDRALAELDQRNKYPVDDITDEYRGACGARPIVNHEATLFAPFVNSSIYNFKIDDVMFDGEPPNSWTETRNL